MQFCQALEPGGSLEEAERVHPELLADLYAVKAHVAKLAAAGGAFQAERELYAERQAQLQASIQQVRSSSSSSSAAPSPPDTFQRVHKARHAGMPCSARGWLQRPPLDLAVTPLGQRAPAPPAPSTGGAGHRGPQARAGGGAGGAGAQAGVRGGQEADHAGEGRCRAVCVCVFVCVCDGGRGGGGSWLPGACLERREAALGG
jgi:hypothetical protein